MECYFNTSSIQLTLVTQQILVHDVIIPFCNLAISNSWKIAFFDDINKPVTTRKVQVR